MRRHSAVRLVLLAVVCLGGLIALGGATAQTTAPDCSTVGYTTDGSGAFEVTNASQLQCIGHNSTSTSLDDDFVLNSDIDASGTVEWNGGSGFKPIGTYSSRFNGTFDGTGHTITSLHINRSGRNSGLVRSTGEDGVIKNVSLENTTVRGGGSTGMLVGVNEGVVDTSYMTGTVSGAGKVGGIVGWNIGTVESSYATGNVSGNNRIGGLVGDNNGQVKSSYATGNVTVELDNVGGLVGRDLGEVTSSYWDVNTTGQSNGIGAGFGGETGVTGLTTAEMKGSAAVSNMDQLDFTSTWDVLTGGDDAALPYPFLRDNTQSPPPGRESLYAGGTGTATNPYKITDWFHLSNMRANLDANFILAADIDVFTDGYHSVAHLSANNGSGFKPIGTSSSRFTGTFDGSEHTISDLQINRSGSEHLGLFGHTGDDAVIEHVGLETATVRGESRLGPLVGTNEGTVTSSYATGTVIGSGTAVRMVGGLVGENTGTVQSSYAAVSVSGSIRVGGLVGFNTEQGTVATSYAIGGVQGGTQTGGFVGRNKGTITSSYWDVNTTGQSMGIGNGTSSEVSGLTTAEIIGGAAVSNMTGFDFTTTWDVRVFDDGIASYPFLRNNTQTPAPGRELYAGGDGTPASPYKIANWVHLTNMRANLYANHPSLAKRRTT